MVDEMGVIHPDDQAVARIAPRFAAYPGYGAVVVSRCAMRPNNCAPARPYSECARWRRRQLARR